MPLSPVTMRSGLRGSLPKRIAGLGLWLDASVDSSLTFNGNGVSEWRDLSGNGMHFSQSTAANQPDGVTRTQGGLRVLDFDGTRGLFGNAAAANLTRNVSGLTVFAVAKVDAVIGEAARLFQFQVSVPLIGARLTLLLAGTTYTLRARRLDSELDFADVNYDAGAAATDANVFTGIVDYANTDGLLYSGGVLRGSNSDFLDVGNSADTASVFATLGARGSGLAEPLDGFIGEIIVYRRALAASERERLEAWLAAKWGIGGGSSSPPGSPPATPTGLAQTACDTDTGTGTIAWDAVTGATSYVLEWSFDPGGPYTEAFSGAGNSTNLDVEGFGGAAYYRVKAVNASGSSAWSDEVYAVCAIG